MAKEERTITGTVRTGTKYFGPTSDADELAAALSSEQIARLTAKGVISGFDAKADKAKAAEAEEAAAASETAAAAPKAAKNAPKGSKGSK